LNTHEVIMREEGEMIGKLGKEFLASVFRVLGSDVRRRALDIRTAQVSVKGDMGVCRGESEETCRQIAMDPAFDRLSYCSL